MGAKTWQCSQPFLHILEYRKGALLSGFTMKLSQILYVSREKKASEINNVGAKSVFD